MIVLIVWSYRSDNYCPEDTVIFRDFSVDNSKIKDLLITKQRYQQLLETLKAWDSSAQQKDINYFLLGDILLEQVKYQDIAPWNNSLEIAIIGPFEYDQGRFEYYDNHLIDKTNQITIKVDHYADIETGQRKLKMKSLELIRAKLGEIKVNIPLHFKRYLKNRYPNYKHKIHFSRHDGEILFNYVFLPCQQNYQNIKNYLQYLKDKN